MMRRRRDLADIEHLLDMAFELEPGTSVVAKAIEVKKRSNERETAYWHALDAIEKFHFTELSLADKTLIKEYRCGWVRPKRGRKKDIRRDGSGQHLTPVLRAARSAINRIGLVKADHERDPEKWAPLTRSRTHQIYKEEATRFKIKSGVREDGSEKLASEIVRDAAADMRYRKK